jgi:hypothetical protein
MCRIRRLLMMGARVPETCRAEYEYNKVLMILRLLCIWLDFYSLLSSLMHGTMKLKDVKEYGCSLHSISGQLVGKNYFHTHAYNHRIKNEANFCTN